MTVLWRLGLLARDGDRYTLTTAGGLLRRRAEGSLWSAASFFGGELYRAAASLPETLVTGRSGAEAAFGSSIWQYMDEHPERGAVFDDMLAKLGAPDVEAVLEAYDFSPARTVVDVGGGAGALLHAILEKHRHVRGVLVETENVINRIDKQNVPSAVLRRCDYMRGSFLGCIPERGDIYILKHVLHDWDDATALAILKNCRKVLSRTSRLLVIEALLDRPGRAISVDWMALGIAAAFGGRERTLDEYRSLAARAGLALKRCIDTSTTVSVVEVTLP